MKNRMREIVLLLSVLLALACLPGLARDATGSGTLATNAGITTATFSFAGLTGGDHTITSSYEGDSNFNGSTDGSGVAQHVNPAGSSTTS